MSPADTALLFGYVLAVPFTVFVPGFRRLWRRREIEVLATAAVGLCVVAAAWVAMGRPVLAGVHGLLVVALIGAWLRAGGRNTAQV